MSTYDDAERDTRLGTSALFAALIKTIRVKDPLFAQRFLDSLDAVQDDLSRSDRPPEVAIEMLSMTRDLIGRR